MIHRAIYSPQPDGLRNMTQPRRWRERGARGLKTIEMAVLSLLILIGITPYLSRHGNPFFNLGLVVFFFFLRCLSGTKMSADTKKSLWAGGAFLGIQLFYLFFRISSVGLGPCYQSILFLSFFFAMLWAAPEMTSRQKLFLCLFSAAGLLANMVSNIFIWRSVGAANFISYYMRGRGPSNAAPTAFSTAVLLAMGTAFLVFRNARARWVARAALLFVLFAAFFLVFVMQRGTAFFLAMVLIAGLVYCEIMDRLSPSHRVILLLGGIGLFVWMAAGGLSILLGNLLDVLDVPRLRDKVEAVMRFADSVDMEYAGGSLGRRFELTMNSVKTFLQPGLPFLIGVGDHRETNWIIGNHSELIDTFARYGILGGGVFLWSLSREFKGVISISGLPRHVMLRRQLDFILLLFIVITLVGDFLESFTGTQLFVTLPLAMHLLHEQSGRRDSA